MDRSFLAAAAAASRGAAREKGLGRNRAAASSSFVSEPRWRQCHGVSSLGDSRKPMKK
jgi:hypothetical protein